MSWYWCFSWGKILQNLFSIEREEFLVPNFAPRLVFSFLGLSLVPTTLLFIVANGILGSLLEEWFSPQITAAVDGSFEIAKLHQESLEKKLKQNASYLSEYVSNVMQLDQPEEDSSTDINPKTLLILNDFLSRKLVEYRLLELSIADSNGLKLVQTDKQRTNRKRSVVPEPNLISISKAIDGNFSILPEYSLDGDFFRAYAPIYTKSVGISSNFVVRGKHTSAGENLSSPKYVLIATLWIPLEMSNALSTIVNAHDDYRELRTAHRPIASSYILTLIGVTLMVIFAALWVGLYLSRNISGPINQLAEGTVQVAQGNLEHRIPEIGDDELTVLVKSFNLMTEDLKQSNEELVRRRRHMETLLEKY